MVAYFNPKKYFFQIFLDFYPLCYVTFYCGRYIVYILSYFKFFGHEIIKKPPQNVAYLSRILVISKIFHNIAQQPKWQNPCSKMWPIEQLYIELGTLVSTPVLPKNLPWLFDPKKYEICVGGIKRRLQMLSKTSKDSRIDDGTQFWSDPFPSS